MRVVDVHAHIVPEPVMTRLRREGSVHGVDLLRGDGSEHLVVAGHAPTPPVIAPLVDVAARLQAMDTAGVDVQLLSPFIDTTLHELRGSHATSYARWFNESLAEVIAEHPDRFLGLANVPLGEPERAAEELRHAVEAMGMVGCEIATTVAGVDLDDAALEPFWATAAELGCLVLLHPMKALEGRSVTRHFLDILVGNPAESTVAVGHLILSGVLERHPGLTVCVVHGGGFLPYQIGRLDRGFREVPELAGVHLTRAPSEWARSLYYDTVVHAPGPLRLLADLVGSERIVVGTDYPFPMGDPDPVATVRGIPGLSDDDVAAVLSGNVERILAGIRR